MIQEPLKHDSLDHLQHQAKQYSNASYNTAPNDIIQERLKHSSLDHLQHQASQYSNEVIQDRTERLKHNSLDHLQHQAKQSVTTSYNTAPNDITGSADVVKHLVVRSSQQWRPSLACGTLYRRSDSFCVR